MRRENLKRLGEVNKLIDQQLHPHFNEPHGLLAFMLDSALHAATELSAGVPFWKVFGKWWRYNAGKILKPE